MTDSNLPTTSPVNERASGERLLVIRNANIIPDADSPVIRGGEIVIRGERIAYVGPARSSTAASAEIIDAGGGYVLPGLIDAHAHLLGLGTALEQLNLVGTSSLEQIAEMVREAADERGAGEWIFGRGWDQNDWEDTAFPTKDLLDEAAPENPVLLSRVDGHAILVNSRAMELAGIYQDTEAPEGGMILRDDSGEPSGVFIDKASALVAGAAPAPSADVVKRRLRLAAEEAARHGLTGIHEAGQDQEYIDMLLELERAGELPIRIYVMLTDQEELLSDWFDRGPFSSDLVTVRAVKLYMDGALGSRGAALLEPYSDADHSGLLTTTVEHVREVSEQARVAGFQVNTHAIGDRGVRSVIEAYEAAGVGPEDRFRIEHLQVVDLDDIERIASLGLIASMQPTHATSDMPWAEKRLGPERIAGAYAWQRLLDAGVPLALGSDFPVEDLDPLLGLYAAVTRQDLTGRPPGGWYPDQRLSIEEALAGFTTGAAWAAFQEDELGRIEEGFLADLVILDRDPRTVTSQEIPSLEILRTISAGRVVYSAD